MSYMTDIARDSSDRPEIPSFIASAMLPAARVVKDIPEQDYIDGHMMPRGVCTILATAGGSGKTTASLSAALKSSLDGSFDLFGSRRHSRPLRCIAIYGEETTQTITRKIVHELKAYDAFHQATASGNLAIISWLEYAGKLATPERVFGDTGALTEAGKRLFAALREWQPDFVMLDTLSSLSDGDYLSDRIAYTTLRELNNLAAATDAAVVLTAHLVKGGAGKISAQSSSDDLIALSRGSAALVNAARHAIVLVPAPEGAYSGLDDIAPGDQIWMCGVKSNIGFGGANTTFPTIRSSALRTFTTVTTAGRNLAEDLGERDRRMVKVLEEYLVRLDQALLPSAFSPSLSLARCRLKSSTPTFWHQSCQTVLHSFRLLRLSTT